MAPRGEPRLSLPVGSLRSFRLRGMRLEDSPSGLWRTLGKRVEFNALRGSNPLSSATASAGFSNHPGAPWGDRPQRRPSVPKMPRTTSRTIVCPAREPRMSPMPPVEPLLRRAGARVEVRVVVRLFF